MQTIWFIFIAFILTMYVLLDGFDLGAGAIYPFVAKDDKERRAVQRAILPMWDGNETWLVAAGGGLFLSFPLLYSASMSGFYLAVFVVLWLLILRGVGLEMRHLLDNDLWRSFWDGVFFLGSLLLPFFFGVALANVMRGVPIGRGGKYFFQSLWTDPLHPLSKNPGILDWYTVMIGLLALCAVILHGTTYLTMKTTGGLRNSSRIFAGAFWVATVGLTALATPLTFYLLPQRLSHFESAPWGFVFPAAAIAGILTVGYALAKGRDGLSFGGSCAYIAGMMSSTAFAIYPKVLPAVDPSRSLTIYNASAPHHSLVVGLIAWGLGLLLACIYFAIIYRMFRGRVEV